VDEAKKTRLEDTQLTHALLQRLPAVRCAENSWPILALSALKAASCAGLAAQPVSQWDCSASALCAVRREAIKAMCFVISTTFYEF